MDYNQDARMSCGEDKTISIAVTNPSGADLTNMVATYIIADSAASPHPAYVSRSSTNGGITIVTTALPPGVAAILRVPLHNDDTALMPPGWYYHEATVQLSNGAAMGVMSGTLRLDPSYTASAL